MMIRKNLSSTGDWFVYHSGAGLSMGYLFNTDAFNSANNAAYAFNQTAPTSTVFSVSNDSGSQGNNSGEDYITYLFAEKSEYSKFGSYTGNGSASGPIINTGFEPAFVMTKKTSGTSSWAMFDNKRNTSNPRINFLRANSSDAEQTDPTNYAINFFSNGFQWNGNGNDGNINGETYLYIAFASDASAAPVLADSFANKLYTGNGGTQSITGLGFSPNLVWLKERGQAANHRWLDTVRGATNAISSSLTAAQFTDATGLTSFDTDGFTLGANVDYNNNGGTFVAWSWKANPVPTINTDGTNQSVVSANQASGFSIVQGTASGGLNTVNSFGHGLGVKPDLIIIKATSSSDNWYVYNSISGAGKSLYLNDSAAEFSTTNVWANTEPTASVFSIKDGQTVSVGATLIAYCFASISGFSKIGTYSGNSSTQAITGLGFSPSWVLLKEIEGVDSWELYDTARGATSVLYPNGNNAEGNNSGLTSFDSDGFTLGSATSANESGKTYLYMAFKENLTPPTPIVIPAGEMAYMVVAGGASGGSNGGGGGAGGLRTSYGSLSGGGASAESNISLSSGTYTITIGGGGAETTVYQNAGTNGTATTISGNSTVNTVGGGGGGSNNNSPLTGGSGGGSGSGSGGPTGAAGTAGEGFAGGNGMAASHPYTGGGGGGTGAVGGGASSSAPGDGGAGLEMTITGAKVNYGGGGGGTGGTGVGYTGPGGSGGTGGGGAGGAYNSTGIAATVNTGGGGGASGDNTGVGGAGGSGVVILRMNTSDYSGSTTGSPTVTTVDSYTILTYTGSGTYVHS